MLGLGINLYQRGAGSSYLKGKIGHLQQWLLVEHYQEGTFDLLFR